MAKVQDRDLRLKLRFRKILFCQGYWSPIEIELSQYEALATDVKRRTLTDLDVLGIKFDQLFTSHIVVGDCKSGRNISVVNRLFWLNGVKEYFGADQAYFIHSRLTAHIRGIAPKLGLRVLDDMALQVIENNLSIDNFELPLEDISIHTDVSERWGIKVNKGDKPTQEQHQLKRVYSYLTYSYWYLEQYRNLFSLISHYSDIASILDPTNERHVLLAYSGLERFALSLLQASSYAFFQGGTNVPRDIRNYIYGGPLALKDKERFFELLTELTHEKAQIDPDYLEEVIELIGRMIENPNGACDILRHISAIYLWCVHLGNAELLPLYDEQTNTAAIVIARDVANTFVKSTGINEQLFSAIFAL